MSENTTTDTLQDVLVTGIPNDITLTEIVPKLPWRYGHLLRTLSKTWQRAYRSGVVYDARVRSQAAETFFLVLCEFLFGPDLPHPQTYTFYLYSQSGDCWYNLPPIPGFPAGLPYYCECMPLNGKLYVLGGRKNPSDEFGMREVYSLDLAGQESQWKQCQSIQVPRLQFRLSVMDGNIFVDGGVSCGEKINRCEKYYPKLDVWSEIQPNRKNTCRGSNLYTVGKELCVFNADVEGGPFEALGFLARRDHPSDDEAEVPFVNEDDDPSDDEAGDELHDGTWIKMIDPELFRDDDSSNCQWFREEINKHGFHQIIEQEGLCRFYEAIKNDRRREWDELADGISYVAYGKGQDRWTEVKNLTVDDLNSIRLMAQPTQGTVAFAYEVSRNPLSLVEAALWPLNL